VPSGEGPLNLLNIAHEKKEGVYFGGGGECSLWVEPRPTVG